MDASGGDDDDNDDDDGGFRGVREKVIRYMPPLTQDHLDLPYHSPF